MAGGDILSTSVSGLLAFQRALATTGHNVSNAATDGYSRQRVDLATRPPTPSGDGFIGNGVQVNSVQRVVDNFINGQLTAATGTNSQLQQFYQLASQVDNLLADPNAGLAPSLQSFFNSANDLANNPASTSARQVMLSQAQSLADRFHYLNQRLDTLRQGVNTQISGDVTEINNLATSIAAVNKDIVLAQASSFGQPANDLLDKRDTLIRQLAQHVAVTTAAQDDGSINVFIGSGQTLVLGGNSYALGVVANQYDPNRSEVALTTGGASVNITSQITGGSLGGALQFRSQMLDAAQNALGRTAVGMAATFNAQHKLGQDLNGALGGNFFNALDTVTPTVLSSSAATVSASVSNVAALTTSDYRLDFTAGNYTLLRLSDNTVVYSGAAFPPPGAVDGITFTLGGVPAAGDSWLIQPTRTGARDIALAVGDITRIAAANPVRTAEATNANGVPTNIGTGKIGAASVGNTTNLPLAANITLTFNAATNQFNVAGGPGGTIAYNPATQSAGASFTFAAYGGMTFTISGIPQDGDSFVISNNTGAVSDNTNALKLADLRNQPVLDNGTATYEQDYGQLVANVGAQTHQADVSRNAQQTLVNQITDQQQSVSGVNLDEEAANMQRYQQAYQASAQMIATAGTLFQTLLAAVRG